MESTLNHELRLHQRPRLWLFAGTAEGPQLAAQLQQRGWSLRVSVVSAAAARPYRPLQELGSLELQIGALAGAADMVDQLQQATLEGSPFAAVIDATHPFAVQVSRSLSTACSQQQQLLLRLDRDLLPVADATPVARLDDLRKLDLAGERILFAIGARHLAQAVACTPGALHHARLLPAAAGLQLAHAAGLPAERIACLLPGNGFAVEAALVRRWRIGTILCRQSGGRIETGWRLVSAQQGCRLLLLTRPDATLCPGQASLPIQALLTRLGHPDEGKGGLGNGTVPRSSCTRLGGDAGPDH